MPINKPGKKINDQEGKTSQEETAENAGSGHQVMALAIRDKGARDRQKSNIKIYEPSPLPQNRPIGEIDFEIFDTFNNRPIESSTLQVIEMVDRRPVMANDFQVMEMYSASGNRPIGSSALAISEMYSVMGGKRPIAPNENDESSTLMGFID
ncbi:hypothetical protein BCD67_12750 [Oscillatoriales cyanobacterium USR001]|nr:hypothetical protein BCD67_12750 [Oscillatoriales cyanobacterium USR001]